jgi:hypothetical protein
MHQPAIFWRRDVFDKIGALDESQALIMDFDYWARIARHFDFVEVDQALACANHHDAAKTGRDNYAGYHSDLKKYAPRYWGSRFAPEYWSLRLSMLHHFKWQPLQRSLHTNVKRRLVSSGRRLSES